MSVIVNCYQDKIILIIGICVDSNKEFKWSIQMENLWAFKWRICGHSNEEFVCIQMKNLCAFK